MNSHVNSQRSTADQRTSINCALDGGDQGLINEAGDAQVMLPSFHTDAFVRTDTGNWLRFQTKCNSNNIFVWPLS